MSQLNHGPYTRGQKALAVLCVMLIIVIGSRMVALAGGIAESKPKSIKISAVCDTVIWQQNLVPYTGEPYHYGYEVVVQISHGQYVNLLVPRDSAGPIVGKLYLFTVVDGRPDGRFLPWKDCKELPFRSTAP